VIPWTTTADQSRPHAALHLDLDPESLFGQTKVSK